MNQNTSSVFQDLRHARVVHSVDQLYQVVSEFIYTDSLWFEVEPLGFERYNISVKIDRKSTLDYAIQRSLEG